MYGAKISTFTVCIPKTGSTCTGALDGRGWGSPMSLVDFRKWQCPLSLFSEDFPIDFEMVQCRMSDSRHGPSHVTNILQHDDIGFMSRLDFNKRPYRPVEFKGQGPQFCWHVSFI